MYTLFEDVEVVALLTADLDLARTFIERELRLLTASDPSVRELRATLLTYLDNERSLARTAKIMHVHRNTIVYRLNRIETLVGRPLSQGGHRVHTALVIADRLLA